MGAPRVGKSRVLYQLQIITITCNTSHVLPKNVVCVIDCLSGQTKKQYMYKLHRHQSMCLHVCFHVHMVVAM